MTWLKQQTRDSRQMSWHWISTRLRFRCRGTSKAYPSCHHAEFEASCLLGWLVFLQIANNVLSSVVNHHNGFQCHQVCHKVQCWAHCCSWYTSTTSQVCCMQGTVLGPLLFLIYINDITEKITSELRLFADDCLLYRIIVWCATPLNHCKTANFFNRILMDLCNGWKNGWYKFNVQKCTSMSVHQFRSRFQDFTYKMNNDALTRTDEQKYLILNGTLTSPT